MNKKNRMLVEFLAPPFLAVVWLTISSYKSETIMSMVAGFIPLLFFACIFSLIPSLIYVMAMEIWFRSEFHSRLGFVCTACLSGFLGAGAGFSAAAIGSWLGFLVPSDCIHFLRIGAVVGLLVGLYIGRKQTFAA
jgi:hypothetical protein